MKKLFGISSLFLLSLFSLTSQAQKNKAKKNTAPAGVNTLLWKISGNGLQKPSYVFGTIHLLCKDDAVLSDSMKQVIQTADLVYFELDMDNIFEMMGGLSKLKMKGDTTLKDLLSEEDYNKVRDYFEGKKTMLPFSVLETYKPIMASSLLSEGSMPCEGATSMEQVIMMAAKSKGKKIKGLETMAEQAGFLDRIPYAYQASELVKYIDSAGTEKGEDNMMAALFDAYRSQDLKKLESLMVDSDAGMSSFSDILLYNRNASWADKLKTMMGEKTLLIAVGAGHLPGEKGLLNLLKTAGYTVTPVENKPTRLVTI